MHSSKIQRIAAATLFAFALSPAQASAGEEEDERMALGREVFTEIAVPQCGLCHILADAETDGEIGPILDQLKPDEARVHKAVTEGIGPMRPYVDLTEEQIDALSFYVATATGARTDEAQ
jgi:cytochrome c6